MAETRLFICFWGRLKAILLWRGYLAIRRVAARLCLTAYGSRDAHFFSPYGQCKKALKDFVVPEAELPDTLLVDDDPSYAAKGEKGNLVFQDGWRDENGWSDRHARRVQRKTKG